MGCVGQLAFPDVRLVGRTKFDREFVEWKPLLGAARLPGRADPRVPAVTHPLRSRSLRLRRPGYTPEGRIADQLELPGEEFPAYG